MTKRKAISAATILAFLVFLVAVKIGGKVGTTALGKISGVFGRTRTRSASDVAREIEQGFRNELPKKLNKDLMLNAVIAQGDTLQYNLYMLNFTRGTATQEQLATARAATQNAALSSMCTGSMLPYLRMGVVIIYQYYDTAGTYMPDLAVTTSYADCVRSGYVM